MEIIIGLIFGIAVFAVFFAEHIIKNLKIRIFINYLLIGLIAILFYKKFHTMDNGLIADIISVVLILVSYFADTKLRANKQKQKELVSIKEKNLEKIEITTREKLASERLYALEIGQTDIKMILKDMQDDTDFRNVLRNSIRGQSNDFVNINRVLDDNYKNILMEYAKITETISLRWYNSIYRGVENQDEMEEYLRNEVQRSLNKIDNLINTLIKKVKILTKHDKKGCLFSEYINSKENRLYVQFELLIMKLSENGFKNEDEIIKAFSNFLKKLFNKFSDLVKDWNELEEKRFEDAM